MDKISEFDQKILDLYQKGIPSLAISAELKISRGSVDRILKLHKVFVFNREKKQRDSKIIALHKKNKSLKDISTELGRSTKTVKCVLIANGLLKNEYIQNKQVKERDETICRLYSEGVSFKKIAQKLGIGETTVYYAVSRANISRMPGLEKREKRNDELIKFVKENKSSVPATKEFHLVKSVICDILKYNGFFLKELKETEKQKRYANVYKLYKNGVSINQLSRDLKMGRGTIRKIILQNKAQGEK